MSATQEQNSGKEEGQPPQEVMEPRVEIEGLSLDKKLEFAKKIHYPDYYEQGKFIDAMDTVNQWCVAEVSQMDQRNLSIHFDGWSSKWDCIYKITSYKVAPFRKYSKGYTGQHKIALRKMQFSLDELHNEKLRVEKLIESDLQGMGAYETTQTLRGSFYIYVDFLMGTPNLKEEEVDAVNDYLYTVLRLIVTYLKKVPKMLHLVPNELLTKIQFPQVRANSDLYLLDENIAILMSYNEMLDVLKKIFCCCHRCLRYYLLYDKNAVKFEKAVAHSPEQIDFEGQRVKDEDQIEIEDSKESVVGRKNLVFGQFINFVNYFSELGGFDAIIDILRQGADGSDEKIPLEFVSNVTAPFRNCIQIFSPTFVEKFVGNVKDIVLYRIRNMSEKEIKEIDKEVVQKVLSDMKDFLTLHYTEQETSEMVESNQLFMAHRFLRSTYLEKRLKGLNYIKGMIDRIEVAQKLQSKPIMGQNMRMLDQDMEMGQNFKHNYPKWLTAEYMKNWILEQKVLETVFGENTHLEIVKRSGCFVKFLAKQGALPPEIVELIWKCQLGKHEEMVRVIFNIIKESVSDVPEAIIDQLYDKIRTVPPKQYDEMFLTFLKDFTLAAMESNYERYQAKVLMETDSNEMGEQNVAEEREQLILGSLQKHMQSPDKGLLGNEKLYGLPLFWDLIQDKMSNQISGELADLAMSSLVAILKMEYIKHIRMHFVLRSIENLIKGESVYQSVSVIIEVICEYQDFQYQYGMVTRIDFLHLLEKQLKLVDIIIRNLTDYHLAVKEKLKSAVEKKKKGALEDLAKQVFMGRHNHGVTLQKLLDFLEFVIVGSNEKVQFGIANIEKVWLQFIQQPNSTFDQSTFLKWINKSREVQYTKQELSLFTDEEKKFFFTKILCNPSYIDLKTISVGQVKCFQKYFILINKQEENIEMHRNGRSLFVVDFQKLIGLDTLWQITVESENDKVKGESMDLLVDLHIKFEKQVKVELQRQIWDQFIQQCMELVAKGESSGRTNLISSAIQCVSKFIDRYDGKKVLKPEMRVSPQFQNIQPLNIAVFNKMEQVRKNVTVSYFQTIGFLRQKISEAFGYQMSEFYMQIRNMTIDPEEDDDRYLRDLGQFNQVLVIRNPAYSSENHPKNIISNNQVYFEKLFSILSLSQGGGLIEQTWDLLMKLPINAKLQQELRELSIVASNPAGWSQILDSSSTFKLLYSLKIVNSMNQNGKQNDPVTLQWRALFVNLGGFKHLLNTFLSLNIEKIETNLTLKCIELLITILFEFANMDKSIMVEIVNKKQPFISKCIQLFDLIGDYSVQQEKQRGESYEDINKRYQQTKLRKNKYKSYMMGNKMADKKNQQNQEEEEDNENQDSHTMQQLIKSFQDESQLIKNLFTILYQCVINNDPGAIVLIPQYENIREMLFKTILRSENFYIRNEMGKKIKEMIMQRRGQQEMASLLKIVEILLFEIETKAQEYETRSFHFYESINNIIEVLPEGDLAPIQQQVRDVIQKLAKEILNREIREHTTQDNDQLLKGKMNLLKVLLQKVPAFKQPIGEILTQYLLHKCLFEIPHGGKHSHQQQSKEGGSPKCKSFQLRKSCVQLLAVLCRDCVPNLKMVLQYLHEFNQNPSWRTNKEHDWNISLRESEKSSTGYVGIKNLGCICYMNSLFQQLFMLPSLRQDILAVRNNNPNNEEKEENMLYQLQLLYTGLLKSEKQYVSPKGFCHAFKDWDGNPTNVLEQMDVEEFFNMFMDRLETAIKGQPQENTIQYHFGGKYTHEMICKGCPHTFERYEPFLAMSVQVKNKKSILEGLNTFIQGDMLEGDNAYLCEKCDKKVDTLKRTVVKKLPRYLIVALKRFEFDFDRMIRVKVNDYCEFPIELNMEPYTQEGLARKEKQQQQQENNQDEGNDNDQEEKLKYPKDYYTYNLTGIVVHSGTADSGHYYSFIKDKDQPDSNKWYEMNDSIVREFDPADIPSECYGGEDTFQGYNMVQMKSMKWRNAYLLFYERKMQEDIEDEEEEDAKKASPLADVPMQSQANALSEIEQKIAYENQKYWQNRFLFGNEYHELIYDISLNWNTECLIPKHYLTKNDDFHLLGMSKPQEYLSDMNILEPVDTPMPLSKTTSPDEMEALEFSVFKLCVGFYIGILQRAHNKNFIPNTLNLIKGYINKSYQCAQWLLEEFCNEQLIDENLLQNPQKEMRKFITGLIYCAMLKVYPYEKDRLNLYWTDPNNPQSFTILGNMILVFIKNMYDLKRFVAHNMQYFQAIARFSSLGTEAREFLLRARIVGRMMDYFFDEASPFKDEFRKMEDINPKLKEVPDIGLPIRIDRKQMSYFQEMMEKRRLKAMADSVPKHKYLFETVSNTIRSLQVGQTRSPFQLDDLTLQLTSSERDIYIPEPKFLKRVFMNGQRTRSLNSLCKGYCHFTWNDSEHWTDLVRTVFLGMNEYDYDDLRPFLILAQYMLQYPADCKQGHTYELILQSFIDTAKNNSNFFRFTETVLDFIFKINARNENVRAWFQSKKKSWEWLVEWIKEFKLPPSPLTQGQNIRLFKKRGNGGYMQMHNSMYKVDSLRNTALFHYRFKNIQNLLENQTVDLSNLPDLDVIDMQDHKFVLGEAVDNFVRKTERVSCYTVENVLDEMIFVRSVQTMSDGNQFTNWLACDTDKLMPRGAVQCQSKVPFNTNHLQIKMVETIIQQLEKQRQANAGAQESNQMYQSDDDEENSDEEELVERGNPGGMA